MNIRLKNILSKLGLEIQDMEFISKEEFKRIKNVGGFVFLEATNELAKVNGYFGRRGEYPLSYVVKNKEQLRKKPIGEGLADVITNFRKMLVGDITESVRMVLKELPDNKPQAAPSAVPEKTDENGEPLSTEKCVLFLAKTHPDILDGGTGKQQFLASALGVSIQYISAILRRGRQSGYLQFNPKRGRR